MNVREKYNLSLPSRPKTFGEEYIFPEDVEKLTSQEIGSLMFKLAAWKGFALSLLSGIDAERTLVRSKHDNWISRKIAQIDIEKNKHITKDNALGLLLVESQDFQKVRERFISLESEYESLKEIIEIYSMQLEILSREISRRSLELRMEQNRVIE